MKRFVIILAMLMPLIILAQYPITTSRIYFEAGGEYNGSLWAYRYNADTIFINGDTIITGSGGSTGLGNYSFSGDDFMHDGSPVTVGYATHMLFGSEFDYMEFENTLRLAPSTAIAAPTEGMIYYSASESKYYGYNDLGWVRLDSIGSGGGGSADLGNYVFIGDSLMNGGDEVLYKPDEYTYRIGNDSAHFEVYPEPEWSGAMTMYTEQHDGALLQSSRYSQASNEIRASVYAASAYGPGGQWWVDTTQVVLSGTYGDSKGVDLVVDSLGVHSAAYWGDEEWNTRQWWVYNGDTNGLVVTYLQGSYPNTITQMILGYDTVTGRIIPVDADGSGGITYWEAAPNTNAIRRDNLDFPVPVNYTGVGGLKVSEMHNSTTVGTEMVMWGEADSSIVSYPVKDGHFYIDGDSLTTNIESGTAAGQMAYWDGSKWTYAGTSDLFWDNTNGFLGLGNSSPAVPLSIQTAEDTIFKFIDAAGVIRSSLRNGGMQRWDLGAVGSIRYSVPGGLPGILFFDENSQERSQIVKHVDGGFVFSANSDGTSTLYTSLSLLNDGNATFDNDLDIAGDADVSGDLDVTGDVAVDGRTCSAQLVLPTAATAPSAPIAGQIYINTTDGKLYIYDGSAWQSWSRD